MRDIDEIMLDRLELDAMDGGLVASVNEDDCTIDLAVENYDGESAFITLSPEQARRLAVFLARKHRDTA